MLIFNHSFVIPAKAGTHLQALPSAQLERCSVTTVHQIGSRLPTAGRKFTQSQSKGGKDEEEENGAA